MAVLVRITDFVPSTLIRSQEMDDELNQLVNILSGVSTTKDALVRFSDGANPALRVDQLGAGVIQTWLQNGTDKARIINDGSLWTPNIVDANSNEVLKFSSVGSAVNEVTATNAATGAGPTIAATGGDANVQLNINSKGTGIINFNALASISSLGRFLLPAAVGSSPSTDKISNFGTYFVNPVGGQTGANTTETDFSSKTTAANTFPVDGDFMIWISQVQFNSNANNKRYRVYFAGNALFDTGANPYNGQNALVIGLIMRRTGTFISGGFQAKFTAGANDISSFNQFSPITFTGTNILKSTGQNSVAAALDVVETMAMVIKGCI